MKKRTIKGFTMLETVVCLAVFSVTLAAAVPAFEEFSEKTDENKFKSQCKNILATAEVMADENYKLGTDRDALIDELNKEFSDYTINVGFEKGKVLWLEVARKENPRMMYYTDEDSFVENKPFGFDVKRSEKTVEWAVEPTPRPVPENPVYIPAYVYAQKSRSSMPGATLSNLDYGEWVNYRGTNEKVLKKINIEFEKDEKDSKIFINLSKDGNDETTVAWIDYYNVESRIFSYDVSQYQSESNYIKFTDFNPIASHGKILKVEFIYDE